MLAYLATQERSNAELYEYILRIGYKKTHANEVLRELQTNNRIVVRRCDCQKVKKGAFYLNYQDAKDKQFPKVYIRLT